MSLVFRSPWALRALTIAGSLFCATTLLAEHALPECESCNDSVVSSDDSCCADFGCDCCDSCDCGCDDCDGCCDDGLLFRGWLDAGYVYNTGNPKSRFNGPYNSQDQNVGMFNQAYLIAEKKNNNDYGAELGGRVDVLYGWDYFLAQSIGLEKNPDGSDRWNSSEYYGLALPQIYGELGNKDASLIVGHWYSIIGYEGLPATSSFFYTKSYSYQFAGPFTHWGILGTWKCDDNWQLQAGVHNGWDQLDGVSDHIGVIGGVTYTGDCQDWWTSFKIIAGQDPNNPGGLAIQDEYTNRVRYSWIVLTELCDRTEYVFHQWLGVQEDGAPNDENALWYGIDQYLYYTLNSQHKLGARFEWFRDEEGTGVGLNRPSNPNKPPLPGNYFSLTVGDNWTPCNCSSLLVRPELRWDSYNGPAQPYADGTKDHQFLLGVDVIWNF